MLAFLYPLLYRYMGSFNVSLIHFPITSNV
jgi:hypothetical protein